MALLSHVFTKAIEWGVVDRNPCREVRKQKPPPRDRYVENWEYDAFYSVAPEMIRIAMDLSVLTGLRPADLLGLTRQNLTDEGIKVIPGKSIRYFPDGAVSKGKTIVIGWTDTLRAVISRAKKEKPQIRNAIICTRKGERYSIDGFNSIWYRHMQKALKDQSNQLKQSFQFRDLRAKSASDDSAEAATARLGHSDPASTERVYRRRPKIVHPLR
jgi:integrase